MPVPDLPGSRGPYPESNGADAANGQAVPGAERDTEGTRGAGHEQFAPDWTLRPGVLLVSAFTERGMTAETFAESSGLTRQTVAGLISGAARVDGHIAQAIAATLGTSPVMWLNAQDIYDGGIARGARDVSGRHLDAGPEA